MATGTIFNIQRYSTHDGPGIRTVVFINGCPLRCYWCQNPESQSPSPVLMHKKDLCVGCGRCFEKCQTGAISFENGKSCINRELCNNCGECAKVCQTEALTISGHKATVEEVMKEILKDRQYYITSGGGVTLSGGEATCQPEFALQLLEECKKKYINTAIETCGYVSSNVFEQFIPLIDFFMFDIKSVKDEKHIEGTGRSNELIISNAKLVVASGKKILIRMPLIPGFNDSDSDVIELREFVKSELGLSSGNIELLKYNSLGEVKYERLDRKDRPSMKPQSDEYFEHLKSLLA